MVRLMLSEPATMTLPEPLPELRRKPSRHWGAKLRSAWKGVKLGARGNSSFCVQFFFAAMVIATAIALDCGPFEWALLFLAMGGVFVAEMIHTAMGRLLEELEMRRNGALDMAAGAVLTASFFAVVVGAIVFINRLGLNLRWW
jgi:undecaprenol kinase